MLMRLTVLLTFICCCGTLPVAADSRAVSRAEPITLEADQLHFDRTRQTYEASGNVNLTQGELELSAEQMHWNRLTGEMTAHGDVRFLSATETLRGTAACYNLTTGTGQVEDGYFFLHDDNLHVRGSLIEQLAENDYRITAGTLTTCDGAVPAWKFGASRIDVTMGGYAHARNTLFYLNDIPAFYFPYLIYPAKTERESGLLVPSVGYSKKRGFGYGGAYYQVIDINQDATFFLDFFSTMGVGKGVEYRYIFAGDQAGEARAYHIDVKQLDEERIDAERYALEWQHSGILPAGVRVVVDALYVNDDEYFRDLGGVAGDYNRDEVESRLALTKNWQYYHLGGLLHYTRNLQADQDTTLQILPRVTFAAARRSLATTRLSYALAAEYTNFWRREGLTGERLMVRPELTYNAEIFNLLSIAPSIAYRQRYYWGLNDAVGSSEKGIAEFTTEITTPPLQRTYSLAAGRLRHSLSPEIVYNFIPEVNQERLPDFDLYDRIAEQNRFEYALVQRLRLRHDHADGRRSYRDLVYLRLALLQHLVNDSRPQGFGDLRAQLTLQPTPGSRVAADLTMDSRSGEQIRLLSEGAIQDRGGNRLALRYNVEREKALEYAAVNLGLAVLRPLYFDYEQRYDLYNNDQLEQRLGIEYRHQCWSVRLDLRERTDDERSFMVTFSLLGIGSVGGLGGNLGGI